MPAACVADLREDLLARVWVPTIRAASRQDELLAEMDALEASGGLTPPDDWELGEPVPDPTCGPPDGPEAWLADLPAELLDEYMAATEDPPCREAIVAGRLPRRPGDGCGFAAGGVADELPPGPVLAGLAGDAWAAGLGRLSDDELIGVLRAARRLASWSAALELAAVTDLATRREAEAARAGSCAPGEHTGDEIAAATSTGWPADASEWLTAIAIRRLETGDCRHLRESRSYRPPPSLRHVITIRQPTCSFPGCRRPAIRCDDDHTLPYDQGGRTCECNLAPLCRRHHRAKQASGWQLTQPGPGTMVWVTPSGRSYATGPTAYPG